MKERLPNLLVLGAMRSGTSWLARVLGASGHVLVAPEKEVHYFDRNAERGLEWYAGRFQGGEGHAFRCDATPNYLFHPELAPTIHDRLGAVRLMVILRNPVDRAYSHYQQRRSRGDELLSFGEALNAEAERIAPGGMQADLYSYAARGRYLAQLKAYEAVFGREALGVWIFEEVFAEPQTSYDEFLTFLGLPPGPAPDVAFRNVNRNVAFRSKRLRRLSRSLPKRLQNVVGRLNNVRMKDDAVEPSLRRRLNAEFQNDNQALSAWLGRDLSRVWR